MKFTKIIDQLPIENKNPSHFLKLAILNSLGSKTLWPDRAALAVEPWLNVRTAPNPESWPLVHVGL